MSDYSSYMWSVPDWRTDELSWQLDNREAGIYRSILDECWVSGSITSDPEALAKFVKEPIDYFAEVWAKIRRKFRSVQNGERLVSKRQEQDRDRLDRIRTKRKKIARKAAKTRWDKKPAVKDLHAPSNALSTADSDTDSDTEGKGKGEYTVPSLPNNSNIPQDSLLVDSKISETPEPEKTAREARAPAEHKNSDSSRHEENVDRPARTRVRGTRTKAPECLVITEAMRCWAHDNEITADLQAETAAMLDHHRGRGNLQADWIATWRTWMRNSKKFTRHGESNGKPKESYGDRIARENRETAARFARDLRVPDATRDGPRKEDSGGACGALLPGVE